MSQPLLTPVPLPAGVSIRDAVPDDGETIATLVRELAAYERLEHDALATGDDFRRHLFGPNRAAEAILGERDGQPIGFALFFTTFSTFRGRPGLYLEDLFVRPEHRSMGIGRALIARVAKVAVERGCGRLEWAVLDWNAPALGFYGTLGARPLDDWTVHRLDGLELTRLAELAG